MLTTLALLLFREVPFARNEKSILEKGSERRNSGTRKALFSLKTLRIIAHREMQIVRGNYILYYCFYPAIIIDCVYMFFIFICITQINYE